LINFINKEAMHTQRATSLFDRIGGIQTVNEAVDIFYQKCIADPRISHFFEHIDLNKQGGKMKVFLACALGAPIHYTGRSMREAHWYMHLTEEHFNAVMEHLTTTLKEIGIQPDLIREVSNIAMRTKCDIVHDGTELSTMHEGDHQIESWEDFTAQK
jgi:hemoglobin